MVRWQIWAAAFVCLSSAAVSAQSLVVPTEFGLGMDDGAITPDGRLGVVRENGVNVIARIYDMQTGVLLGTQTSVQGAWTGAAQDAVEVTNTRAVVLGSSALILDLTNPLALPLGDHLVGQYPRDVAITPDGTLAIVRGGDNLVGNPGGSFVFDLTTGALLASRAGEIGNPNAVAYTYSVDSVVTNDDYAVTLSIISPGASPSTRVSIWDLHPAAGGPPVIAYETAGLVGNDRNQFGAPHDVTLTPDGRYAAVRSEGSVSLYALFGATPSRVWHHRLIGQPGPMGFASMDSVEATNTHIATASRWNGTGGFGAQIDLFDLAGNQWYSRVVGEPHDLAITPDSTKLLVRTHESFFLYDLANLPASQLVAFTARHDMLSTHTFYGAGYDSVAVTDELAVAVARTNTTATVKMFDLAAGTLDLKMTSTLPEKPIDLAFSPNHKWLVVTGTSRVNVYDVKSRTLAFTHNPAAESIGYYPWCDGVEVNDERVLAWGYWNDQGGWIDILSLFPEAQNYCTPIANSTGVPAVLHANGSNSIASNDLSIWCTDLPLGSNGYMVYAAGQASLPFGGGILCISGQRYFMPMQPSSASIVQRVFDYTGPSSQGGAITAGTTWNFQFRYRDPAAGAASFNLSDALTIPFVN